MTVDWNHVSEQLKAVGYTGKAGQTVKDLLEVLDGTFGTSQQETAEEVLRLTRELFLGHSVIPDKPDEQWVPAERGNIFVRDNVKVRNDAYDSGPGSIHNGVRGVVAVVKGDTITIRNEDGELFNHQVSRLLKKL